MKKNSKRIIILSSILVLLLCFMYFFVYSRTSFRLFNMLDSGEDISIELATPDYNINVQGEEDETIQWDILDQLKTYNMGFRQNIDTLFNINMVTENGQNGKNGCMFVGEDGNRNGNTALRDSLRNKVYVEKYFSDKNITNKMAELASKIYADVESTSSIALYAAINAYYNLSPDNKANPGTDEYFNATKSLTREDFYELVFKSENGVKTLDNDTDFQRQVNSTDDSTLYASQVDEFAWLNADNQGLRPQNYKGEITRAEAIYMIVNKCFNSEMQSSDDSLKEYTFSDAKDGGMMIEKTSGNSQILYKKDKKEKTKTLAKGWQLGVIIKMQESDKNEVNSEIYKAMQIAKKHGIIGEETRYKEPISKYEAIELIVKAQLEVNKTEGYLTTAEYGKMSETKVENNGTSDGKDVTSVDTETNDSDFHKGIDEEDGKEYYTLSDGTKFGATEKQKELIDKYPEDFQETVINILRNIPVEDQEIFINGFYARYLDEKAKPVQNETEQQTPQPQYYNNGGSGPSAADEAASELFGKGVWDGDGGTDDGGEGGAVLHGN